MKHLFLFFMLLSLGITNTFAQTKKLTRNNINEWIQQKKPLFLTGHSNSHILKEENDSEQALDELKGNFPDDFIIVDVGSSEDEIIYSSVAIINETYGELTMLNMGTKAAIYPISITNDSIVICVSNPSNTESRQKILFNLSAIEKGEVSARPVEFEQKNMQKYFFTTRNVSNLNDLPTIKCIFNRALDNYLIPNEFTKQDYLSSYVNEYRANLTPNINQSSAATGNEFYIDFAIKLNNYDFDSSSFPIDLEELEGISKSFDNYPLGVSFNFSNNPFVVDAHHFHAKFVDLDGRSMNYSNYTLFRRSFNLAINNQKARDIASKLNEERTATLRLFISPIKIKPATATNKSSDCASIIVPFTFEKYELIL